MRPVNLLPQQHRVRVAGSGRSGGAYIVLGVLGVLLVGVVFYVLTANKVNTSKSQAVAAKHDARVAQAKLGSLSAFGDFSQIATTRKASVQQLAQGRFDWERFLREVSHVLPRNTWLTQIDATVAPDPTQASSSSSANGDDGLPGATINGCARRQSDVATLMVRVRRLHRVTDVTLGESANGDSADSGSGGGTGSTDCGRWYAFNVKADFDTTPEARTPGQKPVPVALGGGS
jgi:Tfp pilus assembly protein PilN